MKGFCQALQNVMDRVVSIEGFLSGVAGVLCGGGGIRGVPWGGHPLELPKEEGMQRVQHLRGWVQAHNP